MRDPNRLDKFYAKLRDIHKNECPDWRFGQLMMNFLHWYYEKYNQDFFHEEEDEMIEKIREYAGLDWTF